jgi:hypothetical protein
MKTKQYLILLSLIFIKLSSSCNLFDTHYIGRCSSSSIESAKSNGTFLSEYVPYHVKVNDSIQFTIKQVFAEKQYGYYSTSKPSFTIKNNKSQIIVILDKKIDDINGYSFTWRFSNLRYDKPDRLSHQYDSSIPPDTIQIEIERVDINKVTGLAGPHDEEQIGHFTIVKNFNKNTR